MCLFCVRTVRTWGLSVNEAMACGRAILANENCGCAIDLVANGVNGFVFNTSDKNLLKEDIIKLAKDRNLVKTMGSQSQRIISSWNFAEFCKAIETAMA